MKPLYPKMLSQLTKRSSAGFLKRNSAFQLATVRYQSNKTASSDEKTKAEVAAKVAKQKQTDRYNALSNQNLIAQQQQEVTNLPNSQKKSKKIKRDYSAIPKVPNTKYFTYEEIAFDNLMNGHRPMLLFNRKNEQISALEEYFRTPHFWSQSFTGEGKFDSWKDVPYEAAQELKPFTPPPSPKEIEQRNVERTEKELAGYINALDSNLQSKSNSKSNTKRTSKRDVRKSKTRGRYRPAYDFNFDNQDF